jgi:riboflavin synthase
VTAVHETLQRSALQQWQIGDLLNLERAMQLNSRLDGHMVQGHVDTVATCIDIMAEGGSHRIRFRCDHPDFQALVVDKGSITVNGVSLTVILPGEDQTLEVAIIPYTWDHTSFNRLQINDLVNIEFDIVGKYVAKQSALYFS